ncbi:hypothetical protein [Lysinibacillus sp. 54212]|uniref:hypothetical protein n=1 Tax=Lysinibacillus sp. 54212 TaxID=3119829 RepID=UPI002FC759B5
MNRIGDIQPLIQDYRSKISDNESELTIKILDDYEKLLQLFEQKNEMINRIWDFHENEKYQLAQETLDPLEQILYSSLLGIRTLDREAQTDAAKEYLASLKKEIEAQLQQLKEASISVYPICMQDLGPYGAIKSYYELLKEGKNITVDIDFRGTLQRQPHKIENNIFRFLQYMIDIIDSFNAVDSLSVTINEGDGRIVITFEDEALVERLHHSSKYRLFKELVDSIEDVEILEKNKSTFNLVLQTSN